jgi:hypothetical protein
LTVRVPPDSRGEPVALDRRPAGDGFLGLGDLLVDAAQGAPARSARYW